MNIIPGKLSKAKCISMIPLSTDSEVALDSSDINNIFWLNADSFLQKLDNSVSYVQHFYMGY